MVGFNILANIRHCTSLPVVLEIFGDNFVRLRRYISTSISLLPPPFPRPHVSYLFFLAVCTSTGIYLPVPYMCNMITEQTGSYCRTFDRYCWEGLAPQDLFRHRRHPPFPPVLGGWRLARPPERSFSYLPLAFKKLFMSERRIRYIVRSTCYTLFTVYDFL